MNPGQSVKDRRLFILQDAAHQCRSQAAQSWKAPPARGIGPP
jgi:hypothetical protein